MIKLENKINKVSLFVNVSIWIVHIIGIVILGLSNFILTDNQFFFNVVDPSVRAIFLFTIISSLLALCMFFINAIRNIVCKVPFKKTIINIVFLAISTVSIFLYMILFVSCTGGV